jgi:hypothetical protein
VAPTLAAILSRFWERPSDQVAIASMDMISAWMGVNGYR